MQLAPLLVLPGRVAAWASLSAVTVWVEIGHPIAKKQGFPGGTFRLGKLFISASFAVSRPRSPGHQDGEAASEPQQLGAAVQVRAATVPVSTRPLSSWPNPSRCWETLNWLTHDVAMKG